MRCVWTCFLSRSSAAALGVAIALPVLYFCRRRCRPPTTPEDVVLITGCDSGLGFSLALHTHSRGLTVVATCLDAHSPGAQLLKVEGGRMHVIQVDVTDLTSINAAVRDVTSLLDQNPQLRLKALVNNAAVMVFGEFEWQTERQIRQQVEVNLLGTMSVTHKFCSLLRKHQGRIIIVSSHCALASLPGLAPYGATKGALKNWADSLRVELAKYGVHVISFVPGSFIDKSNIMTRHTENVREMEEAMSPESKAFYMNYFHNYHAYLGALSVPKGLPMKMEDASQYALFESALFSPYPKPIYINQPTRYAFYHFLFKVTPTWLRDRFVERFVQMPRWCP